jgi:hypothetical protein
VEVLVVNGQKVNSFALALECSSFLTRAGNNVTLVEGNPFSLPFSIRRKTQNKVTSDGQIKVFRNLYKLFLYTFKASIHASSWCKKAKKSDKPWEEKALDDRLPLGRLVRSLIARSMGSSNFSLSECPPEHVYEIAFKSIYSYLITSSAIREIHPKVEIGIAHGGRDAFSAGAICAFREHRIDTELIESGGIPSRWSLFKTSPHFSPDFWNRLQNPSLEMPLLEEISKWWEMRLAGSDHFRAEEWGHTRTKGLLPTDLPDEYISFFTTSDFEIPVFEEFEIFPGEFSNQIEGFMGLYSVARENDIHLIVRRHPNSVDQNGKDREDTLWQHIKNLPGVTYLGPHEKVDSISLARDSRMVFTFKSSVGIEAIWLGVPAFALGPARWAWTDELRVWSFDRLREVIAGSTQVTQDHAVRWASMMLSMDHPNTIFERIHGNLCLINGTEVVNSRLENMTDRLLTVLLMKTSKVMR